jgi:hypothetical protein
MKNRIEVGDKVHPQHCQRDKWMSEDFLKWIDENSSRVFVVLEKVGRSCRLNKLNFTVTEEFLKKVEKVGE